MGPKSSVGGEWQPSSHTPEVTRRHLKSYSLSFLQFPNHFCHLMEVALKLYKAVTADSTAGCCLRLLRTPHCLGFALHNPPYLSAQMCKVTEQEECLDSFPCQRFVSQITSSAARKSLCCYDPWRRCKTSDRYVW